MGDALIIEAIREVARFEISPELDWHDSDKFFARISTADVKAEVRFHEPASFLLGLGEFFDDLAESWKGWPGKKSWESVEEDVALTAVHDEQGHITLTVEFRERFNPPGKEWLVRVPMQFDAGELPALAHNVWKYENLKSPGDPEE